MSKYKKEFIIYYCDSDKNGIVKPESLLIYMGETSSLHSDSLGVGINELRKHNYGWILNRWKVKFNKYPKVKDKIIIETWTSGFDKFYATREFVIFDENREELVRATTLWVFLNIEKKRPIRIPKEFNSKYNILDEKLFNDYYDFGDNILIDRYSDFNVRKSDIDYNDHVNNVNYLNWMLEVIPEEIDEKYNLVELDIHYKKEIKLGQSILTSINKGNLNGSKMEFIHNTIEKGQHEVNAFGRTLWLKR